MAQRRRAPGDESTTSSRATRDDSLRRLVPQTRLRCRIHSRRARLRQASPSPSSTRTATARTRPCRSGAAPRSEDLVFGSASSSTHQLELPLRRRPCRPADSLTPPQRTSICSASTTTTSRPRRPARFFTVLGRRAALLSIPSFTDLLALAGVPLYTAARGATTPTSTTSSTASWRRSTSRPASRS